MWNARLDESQDGIKIAGRNNNLRYTDDTTLMVESEEELKSLLMKVKGESEKAGLKLNIQKMNIMVSSPILSWEIDGENVGTASDFIFLVSKINVDTDCTHEMKRHLLLGRVTLTTLDSVLKGRDISHVWLFVTPWTAACQASLSFTISRSLLKRVSIELVMDREVWRAAVHGVAKNWMQQSDWTELNWYIFGLFLVWDC